MFRKTYHILSSFVRILSQKYTDSTLLYSTIIQRDILYTNIFEQKYLNFQNQTWVKDLASLGFFNFDDFRYIPKGKKMQSCCETYILRITI